MGGAKGRADQQLANVQDLRGAFRSCRCVGLCCALDGSADVGCTKKEEEEVECFGLRGAGRAEMSVSFSTVVWNSGCASMTCLKIQQMLVADIQYRRATFRSLQRRKTSFRLPLRTSCWRPLGIGPALVRNSACMSTILVHILLSYFFAQICFPRSVIAIQSRPSRSRPISTNPAASASVEYFRKLMTPNRG